MQHCGQILWPILKNMLPGLVMGTCKTPTKFELNRQRRLDAIVFTNIHTYAENSFSKNKCNTVTQPRDRFDRKFIQLLRQQVATRIQGLRSIDSTVPTLSFSQHTYVVCN
jgi:hypothetical protein